MKSSGTKTHIEYDSFSISTSSQRLPCIQRCFMSRWKVILLILVVVVQSAVIFTYTANKCITKINPTSKMQIIATAAQTTARKPEPDEEEDDDDKEPHPEHTRRRLPHFIVIGVKKSGTRALLNFLKMHPHIGVATHEVHFFDRDDSYRKGLESYRKQMPFTYPEQLTGEKSPGYYRTVDAPARIHRMNSTIKLIMVVREPVERCMSNYLQHASRQENFPSFESEVLLPDGRVNPRSPHVLNSDYDQFIDNWLDLFERKQLKIIDGNLLISDPHLVMKDLQEFLGIKQWIDKDFFKYDQEKGFYCYYNHSTTLKCLGDSKGRKHPVMNPITKQKLIAYFSPKNQEFFKKIGKTFKWENK